MSKKLSKNYAAALAKYNKSKKYSLAEAAKLVVETSTTKFDSSVEIHINLNVDVRHADQIVRGIVSLPHGTGKKVRIAAFVDVDKKKAALDAGASIAGLDDIIEDIKKGNINFDIAVAEPSVMKELGKIAKILGTKGLMPSPKAGTVTSNVVEAIKDISKGQVEYKTDKSGIIHSVVGKVSFGSEKIEENLKTLLDVVLAARPAKVKGIYINSIVIATTMGPGIKLDPGNLR